MQPPLPPEPVPRGIAAPGLLSYLLVSKYVDHLPLYRLESIFARLGWDVSRSTLCDLTLRCGQVMTPLYRRMCRRVLLGHSLHTDDTALVLLDPRRTAHAWVYVGDAANPYTVFDLSVGHSHEFPQAFLKGYTGFIHADGFAGYDAIYRAGAIHAGCWAHARRYFFDARLVSPELAHEALARIRTLYAVEADAKVRHHTGAELAAYRREHAGPVFDAFAMWLAERAPQVLPKSKIGEAFTYATNQIAASYCLLCHARRFATTLLFCAVPPTEFYCFGRGFGQVNPVGRCLAPSRDRSRSRRSRRNSSASAQMIHCRWAGARRA